MFQFPTDAAPVSLETIPTGLSNRLLLGKKIYFFYQNEQLQSLAEEAQMLKDEMDVLRHSQEKVVSD